MTGPTKIIEPTTITTTSSLLLLLAKTTTIKNEGTRRPISSRIDPSHKICQRMMSREFSGSLGPHISWEWTEKRMIKTKTMTTTARAADAGAGAGAGTGAFGRKSGELGGDGDNRRQTK